VTKWAENVIVGRTLKDKEKWSALLGLDGSVDFVFGSGKRSKGDYTLAEGEMCLTFPDNPGTNGCRKPTVSKGKVLWTSSTDGGATSEIVFMQRIDVEGPRRIRDGVLKDLSYFAQSPDFTTHIANFKDDTEVAVLDAETLAQLVGSSRPPSGIWSSI
jgi:hypothetical protein